MKAEKTLFFIFLLLCGLIGCTERQSQNKIRGKNKKNVISESARSKFQNVLKSKKLKSELYTNNDVETLDLEKIEVKKKLKTSVLTVAPSNENDFSRSEKLLSLNKEKGISPLMVEIPSCSSLSDLDQSSPDLLSQDYFSKVDTSLLQVAYELGNESEIYNYVLYNVKNESFFGATKSSGRTILTRSGTAADKANLMVSLLRAIDVPAHMVAGSIYLKPENVKKFLGTPSLYSSALALLYGASDYYSSEDGLGGSMIYYYGEQAYWKIPHFWVRAYIDNQWVTYDPTSFSDVVVNNNSESYLDGNDSVDYQDWFFDVNSRSEYIKSGSIIDFLSESFSIPIEQKFYNGRFYFGAAGKTNDVVSDYSPCAQEYVVGLEDSGYEFTANIKVKNSGETTVISYLDPLATISEERTYISHSGGLYSTIGNGISGSVELTVGEAVVDSYSFDSDDLIYLDSYIYAPSNYKSSSQICSRESSSSLEAAEIQVIHLLMGPLDIEEINSEIDSVLDEIEDEESDVVVMAGLHNISGMLFYFQSRETEESIKALRGIDLRTSLCAKTYTTSSEIVTTDQESKSFGLVPSLPNMDASVAMLPLIGNSNSGTESIIENLRISREEWLVASSDSEATIWEELFGIRGVSANRALQMAAYYENEDPVTYDYGFVQGDGFDGAGSSSIESQLESDKVFRDTDYFNPTIWANILSDYDEVGYSIWTTSREVYEPDSDSYFYGYFIFNNTPFTQIAASYSKLDSIPAIFGANKKYGDAGNPNGVGQSPIQLPKKKFSKGSPNDSNVGVQGGGGVDEVEDEIVYDEGDDVAAVAAPPGSDQNPHSCNPVNYTSGLMWHSFFDFILKARTEESVLQLKRTYNSIPKLNDSGTWIANGDFGAGWSSNWDTRLLDGGKTDGKLDMDPLDGSTTDILWISEEGSPILFTCSGSPCTYSAPEGFNAELTDEGSTFELVLKSNRTLIFKDDLGSNYNGRLIQTVDRYGEEIDLTYDGNGRLSSVIAPFAGTLSFSRDANNRVESISNSKTGLEVKYEYESSKLVKSIDFDGNETSYEYNSGQVGTDAEGLLEKIIDPLGREIEFEYYRNGKVFREISPGGGVQTYHYSPYLYQKYTRITTPNGFTTQYKYNDDFRVVEIVYPDGGREQQKWNSSGRMEYVIDQHGYKTQFTYDSRGNRTGVKKPLDSSYRQITYNQTFDIPTLIEPLTGADYTFAVDGSTGDVTEIKRDLSGTDIYKQFTYDSYGTRLNTKTNIGAFSNQADDNGLLSYVFHSRNAETRNYDERGRLKQREFDNGRILSFNYDNFDRVTKVADTHGPDFINTYDEVGNLIQKDRIGGTTTHTATFEFDQRNRMISSTNFAGETTRYKYDVVGVGCLIRDEPTKITSPEGNVTRFYYDFAGRKIREVMATGDEVNYKYNLRGDLVAVIDPEGLVTQYEYDGNRNLTKIVRQSAGQRRDVDGDLEVGYAEEVIDFEYDAADRMTKKVQQLQGGSGYYETAFTYDDLDRITQKSVKHYNNDDVLLETFDTVTYTYADLLDTNLMTSVNNDYLNLSFKYQSQVPYGLVEFSRTPTTSGTSLGLESSVSKVIPSQNGPMAQIYRDGYIVRKNTYDKAGRLTYAQGLFDGNTPSVTIAYDNFGRRSTTTHSGGLTGTYAYDDVDRITDLDWTSGSSFTSDITYNADGIITQNVRDIGTFDFGYTSKDEISSISYSGTETLDGDYVNTSLTYDGSGNLSSYRNDNFSEFNNFSTQIDNGTYYWPDSMGLGRVSYIEFGNYHRLMSYYPNGKLRSYKRYYTTTQQLASEYYYDGLGRRIAKLKEKAGDDDTTTIYTHLGLEDKIFTAKVTKNGSSTEVLYVDGQRIDDHLFEISEDSGTTEYVTNHLGSVMNTDAIGGKSVFGLYGETLGTGPAENSGTVPVLYGFTGRELDPESGFYYYRNRTNYDPETARFLTKDPIGINGGDANLYRYVKNNPVNLVDPLGLRVDYGNYVISNPQVTSNLEQTNANIINRGVPDDSFVIRVTGGDRYRDAAGAIRSVTNGRIIPNSSQSSPHLLERGARAADVSISGISGDEFRDGLRGTDFNQVVSPDAYPNNPHFHLALPNTRNYDGPYSNINDLNRGYSGGLRCGP